MAGGMKPEEIYAEVSGKLIAALKEGVIPWEREFTVEGGLHRSFATSKPYRGGNQFYLDLIAHANGYESPFWITMNRIKKLKGSLKKINGPLDKGTGQKSSIVFYYKPFEVEIKDDQGIVKKDKNGDPITELRFWLKVDRVFNLDQVEGIEAPEIPASEATPEERAQSIIDNMPNRPEIIWNNGSISKHGGYDPAADTVKMLTEKAPLWHRVFLGYLVLSTGHSSRLNRAPEWGENPVFSKEALIQEMGAAMFCGITGVKAKSDHPAHQNYIDSWIEVLEENPKMVVQAASAAQRAVDYIMPPKDEEDDE